MKKTAVVTGAGRGIGLAVARQLGMDGCRIVMTARGRAEDYREAVSALTSCGIETAYVQADISIPEDRRRIVEETVRLCGRIDILVNNAGVAPLERADLLDMTEESFDRVLYVNLRGTFFMCQLASNLMIDCLSRQIPGYAPKIVNISSMSAYTSSTSRGEYCVSKAGISMTTALFADRLAEYGIYVYEIRPGIIATDMTATVTEKYDRLIHDDGITPIRRWGTPEDIGRAVRAIAGGAFAFSTGEVFNVDGGFHLRRL